MEVGTETGKKTEFWSLQSCSGQGNSDYHDEGEEGCQDSQEEKEMKAWGNEDDRHLEDDDNDDQEEGEDHILNSLNDGTLIQR